MTLPKFFDRRRVLTDKQKEEIKRLYAAGKSRAWIARKYGIGATTVFGIVHDTKNTFRYPKGFKRSITGTRKGVVRRAPTVTDVRLTEDQDLRVKIKKSQYRTIKSLRKSGWTIASLARKYGVSNGAIRMIVSPSFKAAKAAYQSATWKKYHTKEATRQAVAKSKRRKRGLLANLFGNHK